jgi:hypothetical protein
MTISFTAAAILIILFACISSWPLLTSRSDRFVFVGLAAAAVAMTAVYMFRMKYVTDVWEWMSAIAELPFKEKIGR